MKWLMVFVSGIPAVPYSSVEARRAKSEAGGEIIFVML